MSEFKFTDEERREIFHAIDINKIGIVSGKPIIDRIETILSQREQDGWVRVEDIPSNDDMDDMVNEKWEDPDYNGLDEMENEQLSDIREAYLEGLTDMMKRLFPSPPNPNK